MEEHENWRERGDPLGHAHDDVRYGTAARDCVCADRGCHGDGHRRRSPDAQLHPSARRRRRIREKSTLVADVNLPAVRYSKDSRASFFSRSLGAIRRLPDVQSAGAGGPLPLSGQDGLLRFGLIVEGRAGRRVGTRSGCTCGGPPPNTSRRCVFLSKRAANSQERGPVVEYASGDHRRSSRESFLP